MNRKIKVLTGDYKYPGGFPHYVANGGNANARKWRAEDIDLLAIYREIRKDAAFANAIAVGPFRDSDESCSASTADSQR